MRFPRRFALRPEGVFITAYVSDSPRQRQAFAMARRIADELVFALSMRNYEIIKTHVSTVYWANI